MNTITISGIPDYIAQDLGRYQKATIASIRAFAEAQLKPNARVVVYGIPGKPDLGPDVPTPKTLEKGKCDRRGSGQCGRGMARESAAAWPRAPAESARSGNFQAPEWPDASITTTGPACRWWPRIWFSIREAAQIPSISPASQASRQICCSRERRRATPRRLPTKPRCWERRFPPVRPWMGRASEPVRWPRIFPARSIWSPTSFSTPRFRPMKSSGAALRGWLRLRTIAAIRT